MDVFVARQPILDRDLAIYGYELLYRSSVLNKYSGTDDTVASLQVLNNCCFTLEFADVAGGRPAFVNFTRELLLSRAAEMVSPQSLVVEVLEHVPGDAEVLAACRALHERGYLIAADDICRADQNEPLLAVADFIKVDFRGSTRAEQEKIVARYKARNVRLVAEKLETRAEFEHARNLGYGFFQGYFFARPVVLKGKEIPGFKLNYLRILDEVHRPEIEFRRLEQLIRQEVSVAYKLLKYANCALYAQRTTIESIRRALVILGETEIRKWTSIVLLMHLAVDKPSVVMMQSLVRAAFCESLAQLAGMGGRKSELFLMGMFSLLDAMVDQPLQQALKDIRLAPDIRDALIAPNPEDGPIRTIYRLALAYERGAWQEVLEHAGHLRLETDEIGTAYVNAVSWCDQVFGSVFGSEATEPVAGPSNLACSRLSGG